MSTTREPKVAVVGATGAVGNQLIELIAARGFQLAELKLFATEAGAAQTVDAAGEERLVEALESPAALRDFDVVFLAAPSPRAAEIVAARPGPTLIDLSAANRPPSSEAPMVAPGLTSREAIARMRNAKVLAPPHPVAHVLATCLKALGSRVGFVAGTAMLGASAGGRDALTDAVDQTTDLLSARLELDDDEVQRGFNAFVREHERSLANAISAQVGALLEKAPTLALQVVAIPVLHGSALTIEIQRPREIRGNGEDAVELLRAAPGILIAEEGEPLGVIDAVGQEAIVVSVEPRADSLSLWCVFDNARLVALGALWIAETLALTSPTLA
jgi:aspartate-semialdehyde dehydrogenase